MSMTPAPGRPEPVGDPIREIGRLIETQDNRITNEPLFAVQQKVRDYGFHRGYSDTFEWVDTANEHAVADKERAAELDRLWTVGEDIPGAWVRVYYRDRWEFVTACFTEAGAQAYIDVNGHNLNEPRIYAYSAWRNQEWITLRAFLRSLVAHPTWRCFHCEFATSDEAEARAHFGDRDEGFPLCVTWAEAVAENRTAQLYQDEVRERWTAEDDLLKALSKVEALEYQVEGIEAQIMSRFSGCRTMHDVWCRYDSMEGRALAAEERIEALRSALEESVKLQSHYAVVLNGYDGGERRTFAGADEWLDRLRALASQRQGAPDA